MEKIKNTKILGLVGIICLTLGTILPYVKFSILGFSESLSLFNYWEGKVIILLAIANALFIFKEFIKKYVPQIFSSPAGKAIESANEKMSLIPTILSAVFAIYLYSELDIDKSFMKYGIGFWLVWLGVASLIAYALLYKGKGETPATVQPTTPTVSTPEQPVTTSVPNTENTAAAKFCQNCGNKIDETTNKCSSCGTQY